MFQHKYRFRWSLKIASTEILSQNKTSRTGLIYSPSHFLEKGRHLWPPPFSRVPWKGFVLINSMCCSTWLLIEPGFLAIFPKLSGQKNPLILVVKNSMYRRQVNSPQTQLFGGQIFLHPTTWKKFYLQSKKSLTISIIMVRNFDI